jgi:hypothetical protein
MNKINILLLIITSILLINCGSEERFPINKRYWTPDDYTSAISELNYGYKDDEKLPTFDDPVSRKIIQKITDQENFLVILDDSELGLKYKNDVAEKFFAEWRRLMPIYQRMDRKDNYVYGEEMLAIYHYGLALQMYYFELGNDQISANSDNPDGNYTKKIISENVDILVQNMILYLDLVNEETRFSEEEQRIYAEGIKDYFSDLMERFSISNYYKLERKVDLMLEKTKSGPIESALKQLKNRIVERKAAQAKEDS